MKDLIISFRNGISHFLYKYVLKPIFFQMDPENIHEFMIKVGKFLGTNIVTQKLTSLFFNYRDQILEQNILGINFKNPVGLSAGFDKNAELPDILPEVGFGFAELGSVTGEPCEGNPKPRLWRLIKSESLVVYYGLKNDGAEKISEKLNGKKFKIPTGISIAKTNNAITAEDAAGIADYSKAYKAFVEKEIGDFYVINLSCPNAFGGEPFLEKNKLEALLAEIDKTITKKPIFLKIGPDMSEQEMDELIEVAKRHKVNGFICTNLSKKRDSDKIIDQNVPEKGGISGRVMTEIARNRIAYMYKKTQGKYVIIGSGGIFSAEDAYKNIRMGASIVEIITSMIFEGPQNISEINRGLKKLLIRDGFKNISEVVGADNKI